MGNRFVKECLPTFYWKVGRALAKSLTVRGLTYLRLSHDPNVPNAILATFIAAPRQGQIHAKDILQ